MRLATVGCRCAEVDGEDLHEHFEGEWPGTESSSQVIEKETSSGTVTMLSAVQCCERRNAVSSRPNASGKVIGTVSVTCCKGCL